MQIAGELTQRHHTSRRLQRSSRVFLDRS